MTARTRRTSLACAGTVVVALLAAFCGPEARAQELRVAVLLPMSGPISAIADLKGRRADDLVREPFAKVSSNVAVRLYDTQGNPPLARQAYATAVLDWKAHIVIGPLSVAELSAILPREIVVPTFHLTGADEARLRSRQLASPNLVGFGPLTPEQQSALSGRVSIGAPGRGTIAMIGDQFLPLALQAEVSGRQGVQVFTRLVDFENAAPAVGKFQFVTGVSFASVAQQRQSLIRIAGPNTEFLLFAPPPLRTRLVLAARIMSRGWLKAGRPLSASPEAAQAILANAKSSTNRWDPERNSFELSWSFTLNNASPIVANRLQQSGLSRRGEEGETGSTTTHSCCCRNERREECHCQACDGDQQCVRGNENHDDCTADCQ